MKRNLLTLENYTERYVPLVVLITISDMFKEIFIDDLHLDRRLRKRCDDMHVELSLAITEDQGKGSIWSNIEELNAYISSRLCAKVNLTKKS